MVLSCVSAWGSIRNTYCCFSEVLLILCWNVLKCVSHRSSLPYIPCVFFPIVACLLWILLPEDFARVLWFLKLLEAAVSCVTWRRSGVLWQVYSQLISNICTDALSAEKVSQKVPILCFWQNGASISTIWMVCLYSIKFIPTLGHVSKSGFLKDLDGFCLDL